MSTSHGIERRRFIQLLALTGALAAAEPAALAGAAERTRERRGRTPEAPRSTALRKEIEAQKKALAEMLRVVRTHRLPAGSPPALVFQPVKPTRARERA